MNILALDTSGATASVAVVEDGYLIGEISLRHGKTHSQKVIPMIEALLDMLDVKKQDIHLLAVANGPGSFTGVRIGVVTIKAMAYALNVPIVEVSSLMSLAYTINEQSAVVCPIMDARNRQVYAGIYKISANSIETLYPDAGVTVETLAENLKKLDSDVHFVGDAVPVHRDFFANQGFRAYFAPDELFTPRAAATARLAWLVYNKGPVSDAFKAAPNYLRKSQAERLKGKT
jgi:tRNA threonylcarbamoyladenosine biosynthesis protein TsaB